MPHAAPPGLRTPTPTVRSKEAAYWPTQEIQPEFTRACRNLPWCRRVSDHGLVLLRAAVIGLDSEVVFDQDTDALLFRWGEPVELFPDDDGFGREILEFIDLATLDQLREVVTD